MRIDSHTHVFNLQTVLSLEAIRIIVRRLRDIGVPDFTADAVEGLLAEQLDHPEHLVEEEILARLLKRISQNEKFRSIVAANPTSLPFEIRILGSGVEALGVAAMRQTLDKLSTHFDKGDHVGTGIFDVFETLLLSMQPDVLGVADKLLEPLEDDDVIVALMMDIVAEEEPLRDKRNFRDQLVGTSAAAIQRPGRILPFVAVNPRRSDHFALMQRAVEEMGFVGVKLYPSLGFSIDTPAMRNVYRYCVEQDLPLLMHCTDGGFYSDTPSKAHCDPKHWLPVLEELPELRLCFAHCGGWAGFGELDHVTPGSWTESIVTLMHAHPNVYADLSAHMNQMRGGQPEKNWFKIFGKLMKDAVTRDRLLFGTDAWLTRLHMSEEHYWQYYATQIKPLDFKRIATENPRRFLGLPDELGAGIRPNIARHVEFMKSQTSVGAEPAEWLRTAAGTGFTVRRGMPGWSPNNFAHRLTHSFMKRHMGDTHKALDFEKAAPLRLRQLNYWNKEHVSESVFRNDCRAVALALASACTGSGASFEGAYDAGSAVERLAEVLADGERMLADAGATVDAIFRFSSEAV